MGQHTAHRQLSRNRRPMADEQDLSRAWTRYALQRIQQLVDRPREQMTDDQLSIYTFASNALAGGDPVIAMFARGPGHRLCRICGAEWNEAREGEHVSGCPLGRSAGVIDPGYP